MSDKNKDNKPKKQMNKRSKFHSYAFTWFGYTEQSIEQLQRLVDDQIFDCVVIGFEECTSTKRPHLQG